MSIKKIEIQDSSGNVYYPHTDASVVKMGNSNVATQLNAMTNIPEWEDLVLQNGWTKDENNIGIKLYKKNGILHLKYRVKSGTLNAVIGVLPEGYRPSMSVYVPFMENITGKMRYALLTSNGEMAMFGSIDINADLQENTNLLGCFSVGGVK